MAAQLLWHRVYWFNRLLAIHTGQPRMLFLGGWVFKLGEVIYDSQVQNNLQD